MSLLDRIRRLRVPRALAHGAGNGDAEAIGRKWARTFANLGGLSAQDRILDIGCGPGRMAIGIGERFGWSNAYAGFDIKRGDIAFCTKTISRRHASFAFVHLDIRNDLYNPTGAIAATAAVFPAAMGTIDFAFATSVFTHMLPAEVQRYLDEAARVLAPKGRLVCSLYCLRDDAPAGARRFAFAHQVGDGCFVDDPDRPEAAVAYVRDRFEAMIAQAGFRDLDFHPGAWTGAKGRHGQDVFVARR